MEGEPALRPLTRRIKDRLHLKTHCVGCYLVLLSRETVSSDNGGLELPAVIFRDKSSGRRTIGNGPTALIYLTIVSTLRLSLKFREKESFHVVPVRSRKCKEPRCTPNLAVQRALNVLLFWSSHHKIETVLSFFCILNFYQITQICQLSVGTERYP